MDSGTGSVRQGQLVTLTSSPHVSSGPSTMELAPLANKPIVEKKAAAYGEVVKDLNSARERGSSFKVSIDSSNSLQLQLYVIFSFSFSH